MRPTLEYAQRRVGTLVLAVVLLLGAWSHAFHLVGAFSQLPGDYAVSGQLAHTGLFDTTSDSAPCHDVDHCDHCKAFASALGLEIEPISVQLTAAATAGVALTASRVASTRATTHLTRGPPTL